MLLKAETIISHDQILVDADHQDELQSYIRKDLIGKLVDIMDEKGLIKTEVTIDRDWTGRDCVKMRISARVYNPDD